MIRRKLTLKRVDPWSVLKFGFVVNIALLMVGLLAAWILWIVIGRLGLVDQFCDSVGSIVLDLQECSLNGGNIFRTLLLLGLLGVVVQTGMMVFGAFLYNLIADLTGGLGFTFFDEAGDATTTPGRTASTGTGRGTSAPSRAQERPADQSSTPARPTPDGSPRQPEGAPQSRSASPPAPTSDRAPAGPNTDPGQRRSPGSSGSSGTLWGDPTRSNDRG